MANGFPPNREADLVTFTRNFGGKISAAPDRYSLTSAQATEYAALSDAFVVAHAVANDKSTRSPMNLTLKDSAKSALVANLRMLARVVQNAPTTTNAIRDELNLRHRGGMPSPLPPPGAPYKFAVSLAGDGSVTLAWKCDNPKGSSGTIYQVWRRIGAAGGSAEMEYLGGTGKRRFVDGTIPAGTSQLTYRVQAVRSTAVGPWGEHNVCFGGGPRAADAAVVRRAA